MTTLLQGVYVQTPQLFACFSSRQYRLLTLFIMFMSFQVTFLHLPLRLQFHFFQVYIKVLEQCYSLNYTLFCCIWSFLLLFSIAKCYRIVLSSYKLVALRCKLSQEVSLWWIIVRRKDRLIRFGYWFFYMSNLFIVVSMFL